MTAFTHWYVIFEIATLFERSAVQHQGFTCHGLGLNGSTTPFWRNFKDASENSILGDYDYTFQWKIHHFEMIFPIEPPLIGDFPASHV